MAAWIFQQNGLLDAWIAPGVTPPVGPATIAGIPAQHLRPFYNAPFANPHLTHRVVIPNPGAIGMELSTLIFNYEVCVFRDSMGVTYGWWETLDFSPFPYDSGGNWKVDFILLTFLTAQY
jgi:hypothetical protein